MVILFGDVAASPSFLVLAVCYQQYIQILEIHTPIFGSQVATATMRSESNDHLVLLYSTCTEHCPGHIVRQGTLHKSWHSFVALVQHRQSKDFQTDKSVGFVLGELQCLKHRQDIGDVYDRLALCLRCMACSSDLGMQKARRC